MVFIVFLLLDSIPPICIVYCNVSLIYLLQFKFKRDVKCKTVCTKTYKKGKQDDATKLDFLKMGMQLNYQHHWLVHM